MSRLIRLAAGSIAAWAMLAIVSILTGLIPTAQAAPATYGDFSMMTQHSAGQAWSGGVPATQWAWTPGTNGLTNIAWGDPAQWPPASSERFQRQGDWVYLLGFEDANGFAPQIITSESIGDVNCRNMKNLPTDGRQHYVKWTVPNTAYCLLATGYIDYHGIRVDFTHRQVWFPPSGSTCSNLYYKGKICIKQWEVWHDNNGSPGGPLVERVRRDNILAKGLGPAFIITDWLHGNWRADLRYAWLWK